MNKLVVIRPMDLVVEITRQTDDVLTGSVINGNWWLRLTKTKLQAYHLQCKSAGGDWYSDTDPTPANGRGKPVTEYEHSGYRVIPVKKEHENKDYDYLLWHKDYK